LASRARPLDLAGLPWQGRGRRFESGRGLQKPRYSVVFSFLERLPTTTT
jgi:hypothetical protein